MRFIFLCFVLLCANFGLLYASEEDFVATTIFVCRIDDENVITLKNVGVGQVDLKGTQHDGVFTVIHAAETHQNGGHRGFVIAFSNGRAVTILMLGLTHVFIDEDMARPCRNDFVTRFESLSIVERFVTGTSKSLALEREFSLCKGRSLPPSQYLRFFYRPGLEAGTIIVTVFLDGFVKSRAQYYVLVVNRAVLQEGGEVDLYGHGAVSLTSGGRVGTAIDRMNFNVWVDNVHYPNPVSQHSIFYSGQDMRKKEINCSLVNGQELRQAMEKNLGIDDSGTFIGH